MEQYHFDLKGVPVRCWVACDTDRRRQGLRGSAPGLLKPGPSGERKGMCFVYPAERILVFSMRDVAVPLDLAFVSASGVLVHTVSMAPESGTLYSWREPARFALELAKGTMDEAAVKPGDTVFSPADIATLEHLCSRNGPVSIRK